MAKSLKKAARSVPPADKVDPKKAGPKKAGPKKSAGKKAVAKKSALPRKAARKAIRAATPVSPPPPADLPSRPMPPQAIGASAAVLDRLWGVVLSRRDAPVELSHSARLLSRGTAKVAQKFGEEAVECLIEAVAGNRDALVAESADVLYHLLVLWVNAEIRPEEVWAELQRREGVSGIAEKASRARRLPGALGVGTSKIP
jgi:phosphoribosyl-ATP pyrophosphohydrolase